MSHPIQKVAVLGAGTMGGGIAAQCANAGCAVVMLDIAPTSLASDEEKKGLTLDSKAVRNRIVNAGLERIKKSKPAALFTPEFASRITVGNLEDDLHLIADADWIVEVIVEQLESKQALMARVEQARKPGSIVSSNTSGIPIALIAEGRSEAFRRHFLGTHFFNPPRYLYLLEVIPTPDTLPEIVERISEFGDQQLGKGVVIAKDRPNFIGNRIGIYALQMRVLYALEHGYSVEDVDALTGDLIGNPRTATFRLIDLVGLDVSLHVARNLYDAVPEDEEREIYRVPPVLADMEQRRWLGNKTGIGFYKEARGAVGKEFWPLNLETMAHEAPTNPRFDLVGKARKIGDVRERLRFLLDNAEDDRAGVFIRDTTLRIIAYAARRVPEISDSLADIDRAMRWGFSQQLGPFETWDALGVRKVAEMMQQLGITVAPWVTQMLANGSEAFYQRDNGRVVGIYAPDVGQYVAHEQPNGVLALDDLRAQGRELARNDSASILDISDGVLCLEFHSKMNTIDPQIAEMGERALDMLHDDAWVGLVIGNTANDFSAGANLALLGQQLASGQIDTVKQFVRGTQKLLFAFRTSSKPIVAAPHGRVLGGGVEISLAAARRVASAETYMGLVELGVGLVPGWGGCKEFVRRQVSPHMHAGEADALPYLKDAFQTIALAQVSESAAHAQQLGYLDHDDIIVMNKERLIVTAKQAVLALVADGYTAPPFQGEPVWAMGQRGIAALGSALHAMRVGGYISDYDHELATALAFVMCGGDLSQGQWVSEQYMLDLEFAAIMKLAAQPKSQERIAGMLKTGKPVRN